MNLPPDFHFSQASLRDFMACPRRFLLRYVRRLAWPAIEAEPYLEREQHMLRGALFHRLAEQLLNGIPQDELEPLAAANGLGDWWRAFLELQPSLPAGRRRPEWTITLPLGSQRLVAKFDLLLQAEGGPVAIYDWKTTSLKPRAEVLREDIQTRLYLMAAGEVLGVAPESVSLTYWHATFPSETLTIPGSAARLQRDQADLLELIESIAGAPEESFTLTDDERECRFCVYRSYCERGTGAGVAESADDEPLPEYDPDSFDFSQAAEVAF